MHHMIWIGLKGYTEFCYLSVLDFPPLSIVGAAVKFFLIGSVLWLHLSISIGHCSSIQSSTRMSHVGSIITAVKKLIVGTWKGFKLFEFANMHILSINHVRLRLDWGCLTDTDNDSLRLLSPYYFIKPFYFLYMIVSWRPWHVIECWSSLIIRNVTRVSFHSAVVSDN
jgi:hypothetical protein